MTVVYYRKKLGKTPTEKQIAAEIKNIAPIPVQVVDSVDLAVERAAASVDVGDMLVVLGAGSISKVAKKVVDSIEQRRRL